MSDGDAPLDIIGVEKIGSKPKTKNFFPFAYALLDQCKAKFCWNCLAENVQTNCKSCKVAGFCSEDCEKLGNMDHKYECGAIKKNQQLSVEERMFIRIIGRYKDIAEGNDKKIENFYKNRESERTIMEIWQHCEEMRKDENAMSIFNKLYTRVKEFCDADHMVDEETAFQLHCRNFINRHSISNVDYLQEIGKGLYLDLCKYDHSCRPNAIYSCAGTVATLRAMHDNVDLEDIPNTHYTYIELTPCKIQRRHLLRESWYFECHCDRCDDPVDNWLTAVICPTCISKDYRTTLKLHGEEAYTNPETLEITCQRCHTTLDREYVYMALDGMRTIKKTIDGVSDFSNDPVELLKVFQGALMSYERILPMSNAYFCQLMANMIPLVQKVNMTKKEKLIASLDLHAKCEPFVRYIYRYAHPSKAMHFLQMGEHHLELGNGREAAKYLIESHRIMDYLFDKNHFLYIQTKNVMDHALAELMQFQRSFVNILEKSPEAKKALEERMMTAEEKKAVKDASKKKNKKNKKKAGDQQSSQTSANQFDDLGDLPELVADL